jgi:DNA-binding MarR family transcriptional regulator
MPDSSEVTISTVVDRLIHEPARLAIMTNLFVVESANATYLLQQTGLTWGNLGSHLGRLEEAGYVEVDKGYRGRKPETTVRLTASGRAALLEYRERLLAALAPIDVSSGRAPARPR